MSFPLDYDSACDTCTRAAVCVFIFKSFAVLSVKSRTLPVKSDSWGKRKSLFSFFVLGVCCWTFVLLLFVVFCLFLRQGGMHAVEAGLKLTLWLIMTSCGWNICTPPPPTENCVIWMTFSVCENSPHTPLEKMRVTIVFLLLLFLSHPILHPTQTSPWRVLYMYHFGTLESGCRYAVTVDVCPSLVIKS